MRTAQTAASAPGAAGGWPPELSFDRVVDLALIHRRNPSEAFLTSAVRTGPEGFAAAALLPPAHPHYTSHTGPSRGQDPMLLLECARQAETYAAHTMYGVEPDARFILRTWSAEFIPRAARGANRPVALRMKAVTSNPLRVRDQLRRLDYDLELHAAGERAGRVRMDVSYLSAAAYLVIRSRKRRGSPRSCAGPVSAAGCPVDPARVGRVRATDTLLLEAASAGGEVWARLRVPTENVSLFDHAQDHIPAMVLVEAARQLATLATAHWGGPAPRHAQMVAMSASFADYTELDEPVRLAAAPAAASVDGRAVDVTFQQAAANTARVRVDIANGSRVRRNQ